MNDHALGRLVALEFLVSIDDELHEGFGVFAGKMR
jgi:hypothetical protein